MDKIPKICLLGGSNSIKKFGFSSGLCTASDLNLAIGASSSIQNIHALLGHQQDIAEADVIVTESNVNDFANIDFFGYKKEVVFENTGLFFEELYRTGKPVIVVLIPIIPFSVGQFNMPLYREINALHKSLANKYGFKLLDITSVIDLQLSEYNQLRMVQPDQLHPSTAYMFAVAERLRAYIEKNIAAEQKVNSIPSNFEVTTPTGNLISKSNTRFTRLLRSINQPYQVALPGSTLVGIETWCNGDSQLKIEGENGQTVVKSFNALLAFNEIQVPISGKVTLSSIIGDAASATEPSANVEAVVNPTQVVRVSSFLFRKDDYTFTEIANARSEDLNHLLPPVEPFINATQEYIQHSMSRVITPSSLSIVRDSAIQLEQVDLKLSLELMNLAKILNPKGAVILKKIKEYERKLGLNKGQND